MSTEKYYGSSQHVIQSIQNRMNGIGVFEEGFFNPLVGTVDLLKVYLKHKVYSTDINFHSLGEVIYLESCEVETFVSNFISLLEKKMGLEHKSCVIQNLYASLSDKVVYSNLIQLNFIPNEDGKLESLDTRTVLVYKGNNYISVHYLLEGVYGELVVYCDANHLHGSESKMKLVEKDLSSLIQDIPVDEDDIFLIPKK